jgi:hypothetical protein
VSEEARLTLTMISALKPCKKCDACREMVARLQARFPGRIEYCEFRADAPEAAQYGVIMPPMLIMDDFIVASGNVPVESGLTRLLASQLGVDPAQ